MTRLVEKPQDDRFTETLIGAYYVRDGAALRAEIKAMMAEGRTGAGGEYQLTDALDGLVRGGARVETQPVAEWLDVGTVPAYLDAVARTLDREGHRSPDVPGVTIIPPVYIAPTATVGSSSVGPYASIENRAIVEGSSVRDAVVFPEASVEASQLAGAVVGRRASAMGAVGSVVLGDDSDVGTQLHAEPPLNRQLVAQPPPHRPGGGAASHGAAGSDPARRAVFEALAIIAGTHSCTCPPDRGQTWSEPSPRRAAESAM